MILSGKYNFFELGKDVKSNVDMKKT